MKLKLIGNVFAKTRILRSAQDDRAKLRLAGQDDGRASNVAGRDDRVGSKLAGQDDRSVLNPTGQGDRAKLKLAGQAGRTRLKLAGVLLVTAVIAAVTALGIGSIASAQDQPPEIKVIIFQGNVTVAGQPAADGLRITARIGSDYESNPAFIGAAAPGRYTGLAVGDRNDLVGQTIQFWLDGQVLAQQTDVLAPLTSSGQPCPGCSWTLPLTRTKDLTFATAPVATPTPSVTPTPTQFVVQPSFYGGRVIAGAVVPPDGYEIYARIGDYTSMPTKIIDGRFGVVVDPKEERFIGQQIRFFIGDVPAIQLAEFQPGVFNENLNLVFAGDLPSPTPTLTPTASATPTPEPSRTPTVTPSPSPTVTPTATPTLTADAAATATALANGGEVGGGFCSANAGGPASVGILGLLLAPIGLLAARRLRQARSM